MDHVYCRKCRSTLSHICQPPEYKNLETSRNLFYLFRGPGRTVSSTLLHLGLQWGWGGGGGLIKILETPGRVGRYAIGRYIDRHSADILVDSRSIYRPSSNPHSADYRPSVGRMSAQCRSSIGRYDDRYWTDTGLTFDRHSADSRPISFF